jgi:hypothetical protein
MDHGSRSDINVMEASGGYVAGSLSRTGSNPGGGGLVWLAFGKKPLCESDDGECMGNDLDGGEATLKYNGGVRSLYAMTGCTLITFPTVRTGDK